jgi:hypothetical protein
MRGIMPKTGKKVNNTRTANTGKVGWELALEQAKSHLYKNRMQRSRLMTAIRFFQEKIKNGDPWPGDKLIQSPSRSA